MWSPPKSCYEGYDRRWTHTRRAHQLPPLDDLFQTFKNLASDDDLLLFARWNDSLFTHRRRLVEIEGICLWRHTPCPWSVTIACRAKYWQRPGSVMSWLVYAPRNAYEAPG
jgi:hypothetical protein